MHLNKFDLNLLIALDALLQEKNVTRAAERVFVSQPAMSAALQKLRDTVAGSKVGCVPSVACTCSSASRTGSTSDRPRGVRHSSRPARTSRGSLK